MTGIQKQQLHAELCQTTRRILGKTYVPASRLRNLNGLEGTAEVHHDGRVYEAVLEGKSFKLTGNYTTL